MTEPMHASQSPDSPAHASGPETVFFARKLSTPELMIHSTGAIYFGGILWVVSIAGCALLMGVTLRMAWPGLNDEIISLPVIAVGLTVFMGWVLRRFRVRNSVADLPVYEEPEYDGDPWSRIVCIGHPAWVAELGGLTDRSFEPVVAHTPGANMLSEGRLPRLGRTAMLVTIAIYVIMWVIMREGLKVRPGQGDFLQFFASIFLAFIIVEFLIYPAYLRVVPGRLDVMRFNNFSSRPPHVRAFDLRKSRLFVDMVRGCCIVREAGITSVIPFSFAWRRRHIAYHLLLAAVSTHEPAPLPTDELLG